MNDRDPLLDELGELAREERRKEMDRLDERWDRLAAGELSETETEELRREAERSEQGRRAWAAFAPLDGAVRQRIAAAALQQVAKSASPAQGDAAVIELDGKRAARGRVAGRRRWGWPAAAALAAAAVLLLLMLPLLPGDRGEPLPAFELALTAGVSEWRAEPDPMQLPSGGQPADDPRAVQRLTVDRPLPDGSRFELLLSPRQAVEPPPAVATYRQSASGLAAWPLPVEISPFGSVRIAGRIGEEIALPAGDSTLVVVVGRAGRLPADDAVAAALAAALAPTAGGIGDRRPGDWRLFAIALRPGGSP